MVIRNHWTLRTSRRGILFRSEWREKVLAMFYRCESIGEFQEGYTWNSQVVMFTTNVMPPDSGGKASEFKSEHKSAGN